MINAYEGGSAIFNPFVKWIIYDDFSIYSLIFLLTLPVLASIPYSDSYWLDLNSGFAKSVYTRTKKSNYLISRYITNYRWYLCSYTSYSKFIFIIYNSTSSNTKYF